VDCAIFAVAVMSNSLVFLLVSIGLSPDVVCSIPQKRYGASSELQRATNQKSKQG
jgi:hypothetical protein